MRISGTAHGAPSRPGHALEETAARALRRIGVGSAGRDGDLARQLLPFVIDAESLHTIPPLDVVPEHYVATRDDIGYRNVALPPVPVLAPPLAHFLVHGRPDAETVFLDGHNVYGANLFGQQEGRRLLRRAIGFVHEELARQDGEFDIVSHEADGFLVSRARAAGRPSLREQVEAIVERMAGEGVDDDAGRAIRARLATFHRNAAGDVLAPASFTHQPCHDLDQVLATCDLGAHGGADERLARLGTLYPALGPLVDAVAALSPRERSIVLTLLEHRMYDPVLHGLAEALSTPECPLRAVGSPGELGRRAMERGATVVRLEALSVLKAINEHPHGGFLAGNAALRAVFRWLVTTLQRIHPAAQAGTRAPLLVFRRWGDFYFCLDRPAAAVDAACAAFEAAAETARYLVIAETLRASPAAWLQAALPSGGAAQVVVPFMPVVAFDAPISDDILGMPVDPPAHAKRRAIAARLGAAGPAPDLDVAFLADWTVNACDPNRGIPRLMGLLHATAAEVANLAQYYEPYVSRKGKTRFRIRPRAGNLRHVADTLRGLLARAGA